jgi:hypothetical protein
MLLLQNMNSSDVLQATREGQYWVLPLSVSNRMRYIWAVGLLFHVAIDIPFRLLVYSFPESHSKMSLHFLSSYEKNEMARGIFGRHTLTSVASKGF